METTLRESPVSATRSPITPEPARPITVMPRSRAICSTADPTPPDAPLTSSVSPGRAPTWPMTRIADTALALFSHFSSKEALVFEQDADLEESLVQTVADRRRSEPLIPALRQYEDSMRQRHAQSLAAAIAADLEVPDTTPACSAIARFVVDAFSVARDVRPARGRR